MYLHKSYGTFHRFVDNFATFFIMLYLWVKENMLKFAVARLLKQNYFMLVMIHTPIHLRSNGSRILCPGTAVKYAWDVTDVELKIKSRKP